MLGRDVFVLTSQCLNASCAIISVLLFIFILMLRFLCQIKYWHKQVPEIKVVPAYALVNLVFHFHDFISQENSNYVTLVETDANNTKFTTALLSPQGLLSMGGWKLS